jgi:hypothetical protein
MAARPSVVGVKYLQIIADNLRKADWRCGCISTTDEEGRQFWVVAAEREDARRFIVQADDNLSAFLELDSAIRKNSVDTVCRRLAMSRSR